MAVTTGLPLRPFASSRNVPVVRGGRQRRITPQAGRALEKLGHAIEYLADELAFQAAEISAHDPQLEAIQLLMALNREVYFSCPAQPILAEKLRAFFRTVED